jgi:putative tryptophan/tyrosine transport system substrate-binding protein
MQTQAGDRVSNRREFITLLGGAAAMPVAARAQQTDRVQRIGVLMGFPESDSQAQRYIAAFRDGLHKLGWTEGRNVRIDTRWATPAEANLMRQFAKSSSRCSPTSFFRTPHPPRPHCCNRRAPSRLFSRRLPIRLAAALSASFPRPGGNITGFAVSDDALGGKWLERLKEIAPRVARVAIVFNPAAGICRILA